MKINIGDLIKCSNNNILYYVSEIKNDHVVITFLGNMSVISYTYALTTVMHYIQLAYFIYYPITSQQSGKE